MRLIVLGGGIAGVSCAQQVRETAQTYGADVYVTIISASPTVKLARNVKTLSRARVTFDVVEENEQALRELGIDFVFGEVTAVDRKTKVESTYQKRTIVTNL